MVIAAAAAVATATTVVEDSGDVDVDDVRGSGGGVKGGRVAEAVVVGEDVVNEADFVDNDSIVDDAGVDDVAVVVVVVLVVSLPVCVAAASLGDELADESDDEERGVADAELLLVGNGVRAGDIVGVMSGVEAGVIEADVVVVVVPGARIVAVGAGHSEMVAIGKGPIDAFALSLVLSVLLRCADDAVEDDEEERW